MFQRSAKKQKQLTVSDDASDVVLLELIATGSEAAFEILYRRHSATIIAFCSRMLNGDVPLAADIADEAFFEVWKSAKNFQSKSKPLTWIHSIARNKLVDYLRKNASGKLDVDKIQISLEGYQKSSEELHGNQTFFEDVVRFMDKLSDEHKEIITMAYFQELSIKEIAAELAISENTVKTRMFYARKRLQSILSKAGISGDEYDFS